MLMALYAVNVVSPRRWQCNTKANLPRCHNAEHENFVRQKLYKMRADNTGGLPYELILVLNRPYMITNSIDVADELSNGPVGKIVLRKERRKS
ncbi:uncharacterized protein TNCV_2305261 [Trichonephila clavipes]|nr:uncharacterized protein TNCV_2305261 [Trichonephila clavipes]